MCFFDRCACITFIERGVNLSYKHFRFSLCFFFFQTYVMMLSISGHCPHTLGLVLNVHVFHLSWESGATCSAASADSLNICSGQSCWRSLHFIHLDALSPFFDWQCHTFVCCGVVCSILYWGLSCRFPLGVSESQLAASAVLLQSLYNTSTHGSADRQDTGDVLKIWMFSAHICEGLFSFMWNDCHECRNNLWHFM